MRFGWIAVIAMAVLGFWIHGKRSPPQATQANQATFTPGVWLNYAPRSAGANPASGKVRLSGLRVIAPQTGFEAKMGPQALDSHIRQVERHAIETLASAKAGTVLVRFITSPGRQLVLLTARGQVTGQPLQVFLARLAAMEQLPVGGSSVVFELRVAVAP